ncbi:MAG: 4Fe-4S dicluster domain-containing protein [Oscillibacter sp.]|nr:4Fe-4S dicluster domain-containing protein [Oscillibacter sp.]
MGINPHFKLNKDKCISCGACIKVCEGIMLEMDEENHPAILGDEAWEARGCWGCQHCMAVCPVGAISVMDKDPADSTLPPKGNVAEMMDALILNRRSCRRYIQKAVDSETVEQMLRVMENAPTGGNRQSVEYTVVTDQDVMKQLRELTHIKLEELTAEGKYPFDFGKAFYDFLVESEKVVRPNDLVFCSAPNLFIAHQVSEPGSVWELDNLSDCSVADTYFELLCAAHGLGAVLMSTPVGVLNMIPEAKKLIGIPEDHCIPMVVGFGYPEIKYPRSVQREGGTAIYRVTKDGIKVSGRIGGHYAEGEALD